MPTDRRRCGNCKLLFKEVQYHAFQMNSFNSTLIYIPDKVLSCPMVLVTCI